MQHKVIPPHPNITAFRNAFGAIEDALREILNRDRLWDIPEAVRQASEKEPVVATYATDLTRLSTIRNLISHGSDPTFAVTPSDRAVRKIEHIAALLVAPPLALDFYEREVFTLLPAARIGDAVRLMREHSFSQMPIYQESRFFNLLTTGTITRWLGASVDDDLISLQETPVSEVLLHAEVPSQEICAFVSRDVTLMKVQALFTDPQLTGTRTARLDTVLITDHGQTTEPLLGIITAWDLADIHNRIERHHRLPNDDSRSRRR